MIPVLQGLLSAGARRREGDGVTPEEGTPGGQASRDLRGLFSPEARQRGDGVTPAREKLEARVLLGDTRIAISAAARSGSAAEENAARTGADGGAHTSACQGRLAVIDGSPGARCSD